MPQNDRSCSLFVTGCAACCTFGLWLRVIVLLYGPCALAWNCMQTERRVYEAASRAVLHQREPDGTKKTHPPHPLQAVTSSSAGTDSTTAVLLWARLPAMQCVLCSSQKGKGQGKYEHGIRQCCRYVGTKASIMCLSEAHECYLPHRIVAAFIAIAGCHAHVVPSSSSRPQIVSPLPSPPLPRPPPPPPPPPAGGGAGGR